MAVVSFKDVKVVKVGMVIRSINGIDGVITKIIDFNKKEHQEYLMPQDNNMILEFDHTQYMWAEIPWCEMDSRVLVMNYTGEIENSSLS